MFKKNFLAIFLWILFGSLTGLMVSSFYGKTEIYIPFYHDISNVLERTSPSVVNIWTIKKWKGWQEQSNKFGLKKWRQVVKTGFFPNGSGVVFDKDGKIVTNFHVIKEAFKNQQRLIVELNNGEISEAVILGFSEDADIAVIQTMKNSDLKPIKFKKILMS